MFTKCARHMPHIAQSKKISDYKTLNQDEWNIILEISKNPYIIDMRLRHNITLIYVIVYPF